MIEMLRKFSPDGIEISFADPDYLFQFDISDENVEYLKTLPYVTIHAPWKNIRYSDNEVCAKTLKAIEALYNKIDAKNVTIHSLEVDDYKVLNDCKFKISTENEDYRKPCKTPLEIGEVLKKNPKIGFTFDFAHGMTVDLGMTDNFLNFAQLQQVHLAYFDDTLSDHFFLCKHKSDEIEEQIKKIPENVPLVLEAVAEKKEQIAWVKDEIEYLRGL
jgi:hypothetical protein